MISNQLYSSWRLVRDRLIQNLWVTAIFLLGCMFALPIQAALIIPKYIADVENKYVSRSQSWEYILKIVGQENDFLKLAIIITAIVMGWAFFSYLHSKKQIDFYHSLPISRGRMFLNNFIAGNISFILVYLSNLILTIAIIGFMGFASSIEYMEVIKTVLVNVVFFNLIFSISILSGIITGTKLTHVLMTGAVLEYLQLLVLLINEYLGYFFKTFYPAAIFTDEFIISLSPLSNYFSNFSYGELTVQLMMVGAITVLNIYVFVIRPSETSGKSLLNQRLKEIVKYMILSLGSMAGGLIFYEVGQGKNWMIFGFFFSCIIGHCILESLLNFDMKSIFSNKRKLVVFAILATLFFLFMDMDLIKYDTRIPEIADIESVSIKPVNFDEYASYYEDTLDANKAQSETGKLDKVRLSNPESIESIVEISRLSVANQQVSQSKDSYLYDEYLEMVVKFNLKDGKNIIRHYEYAPREESLEFFASIFDTQEFKYRYYPVMNLKADKMTKATIEFPGYASADKELTDTSEIIKHESMRRILKAAQNDFLKIKSKDLKRNSPIALITFYEKNESGEAVNLLSNDASSYDNQIEVPVFKEYEETLKMLSAYGCNKYLEINSGLISHVKLYSYDENSGNKDDYYNSGNQGDVKIIETEPELEKFLEEYLLNFHTNLNPFLSKDTNKWATVYFKSDNNSGYDFAFAKQSQIK
ncbi:MAG: DUF6449 domain-containing protein [Proteocatella sp.]